MADPSEQQTWQGWFWIGLALAGVIAFVVITQWPGEPAGEPGEPDVPGAQEIEDDEEVQDLDEEPGGRPPGSAPADPRRPATVPDDGGASFDGDSDDGDDTDGGAVDLAETGDVRSFDDFDEDDGDESDRDDGEADEGDDVRAVPEHLREEDAEEDGEEAREGDETADEDDARLSDEERQQRLEEAKELPEEAFEETRERLADGDDEEGDGDDEVDARVVEDGELVDEEETEQGDGDDDAEGEELDEELADDSDSGEDADEREWDDEPVDDYRRTAPPPTGDVAGSGSRSSGSSDEVTPEDLEELADRGVDDEPPRTREAFEDYREVLDDVGTVDADNAADYSMVAAQQAAQSLYALSAGGVMPRETASRQRDEIADAAGDDQIIETDEVGEEFGVDGGDEASEDGDRDPESDRDDGVDSADDDGQIAGEESDGEWTVWMDVADWLRHLQREEYPQLEELVDDVEEAADELDPEVPEHEQIDELVDFYEAVEDVLEAMDEEQELRSGGA